MNQTLYVVRREMRLKQKEVAEKIGMHPQTYHLKECGKREFTISEGKKLAVLFGKTLDELFS